MGKKTVKFNQNDIDRLPNDKPALYRIKTKSGKDNYIGTAKRGRVRERIEEHLEDIPGTSVTIEQFGSIDDARKKESRVIKRNQPKYNNEGK